MPSIEIIISPAGETRVQTTGYAGPACRAESEFIERALGEVSHEQITPEFHQMPVVAEATETEAS